MVLFYCLTIIMLLTMFMLFKKRDKSLSILREIIYSICLLFCYNVFLVFIMSKICLGGNLLSYSIANIFISLIILILIIKRKEIQKYNFDKKEFFLISIVCTIVILIAAIKFNGFTSIRYVSGDSAIHYRQALTFSKELSLLDKNNSKDILFNDFNGVMSISYINGGFFINIMGLLNSYKAFIIYDSLCYMLCSLLFLITMIELFKIKKNFLCLVILSLIYCLAFPLNSFIFGFCYLGLSVMVINLLLLTILKYKNDFNKRVCDKIFIILLITFSVFFSYYLFVPSVYLALGIYYIVLMKRKEISMKEMFLYGIVTLIIPFIIGFIYFIIPFYSNGHTLMNVVKLTGTTYDNVTPIYFFVFFTVFYLFNLRKDKDKFNYLNLSVMITTIYISIFFILFCLKKCEIYYFYKLFYVYWLFSLVYLFIKFINYKKLIGIVFLAIIIGIVATGIKAGDITVNYFGKLNIYNYNLLCFDDFHILLDKEELEIVDKSIKYRDMCVYDNTFPVVGNRLKNYWFYSITGNFPIIINSNASKAKQMEINDSTILTYDYLADYKCIVYFYENKSISSDIDGYDILYHNGKGALLKRKDERQKILDNLYKYK